MAAAPPPPAGGGGPAQPPPPALPVPAPTPASFATLFADASLDPAGGNPSRLLGPLVHNVANPAANTSTADLRTAVAISGRDRQLIAVTVIADGRARAYLLPF